MSYELSQVFGVGNTQPRSYIERLPVDNAFRVALKSQNAIVVYGASKQGKTALVSRYLPYADHVVIRLTPATRLRDIYQSILRQNDVDLEESNTASSSSETATKVSAKWTAILPFLGGGEASAEGGLKASRQHTRGMKRIPFNLDLPQDVGEILSKVGSKKVVILENFHYLSDKNQRLFSFDLRTFQEIGIKIIVLGVWREKNRMLQFNGDLVDRVTEIAVEPWTDPYLFMVAREGEKCLNLEFSLQFLRECVIESSGSIGVFQEILRGVCEAAHVLETRKEKKRIDVDIFLKESLKSRAIAYEPRHRQSLISLATPTRSVAEEGSVDPFLPYYFILSILVGGHEGMRDGIPKSRIEEDMLELHPNPEAIRSSQVQDFLENLGPMQADKAIAPPIFDFDNHTDRLQIVDSTFYFFMKHADLARIMKSIPGPNRDVKILLPGSSKKS